MLPGQCPSTIVNGISYGIIQDHFVVDFNQQVAPLCVAIDIIDCADSRPKCSGGVGIALFAEDVAGIIIGPYPSPARGLVILPDQLIGAIVGIGSRCAGIAGCYPCCSFNCLYCDKGGKQTSPFYLVV